MEPIGPLKKFHIILEVTGTDWLSTIHAADIGRAIEVAKLLSRDWYIGATARIFAADGEDFVTVGADVLNQPATLQDWELPPWLQTDVYLP